MSAGSIVTRMTTLQPQRLLVVVPYRDRSQHRDVFVPHLTQLLRAQNIPFQLVFIEQLGTAPFNRGLLANIGVDLYGDTCDYVCVHDVDILGEENFDYGYAPSVTHLSARQQNRNYEEWYARCIGGVTLFPIDIFRSANGFANKYWGWGAEDDDLRLRLDLVNAPVQRKPGKYRTLPHESDAKTPQANYNAQMLAEFQKAPPDAQRVMLQNDGLTDVKTRYKVVRTESCAEYEHVAVSFESTICLSMIVKNETAVITECLASVAPHIDYWVIVDTGSTDGTQELVRKFFAERNIPGELHERPWVDFGTNRSEALKLCDGKADYAWMIDADDKLEGTLVWPEYRNLHHDCYLLKRNSTQLRSWRRQVFRAGIGWEYRDVIHEYAYLDRPFSAGRIEGDYFVLARTIGCRGAGLTAREKYLRDADVLLAELKKDPTNARHQFYLGQSYFDAQELGLALDAFQTRVKMGGWHEEVYQSFMFLSYIASRLELAPELFVSFLMRAWNANPARAEPLVMLSRHHRARNELCLAYIFARQAATLPVPSQDFMFINMEAYTWQALDELAATAHAVGDFVSGAHACEMLLHGTALPPSEIQRVKHNYKIYLDRVY